MSLTTHLTSASPSSNSESPTATVLPEASNKLKLLISCQGFPIRGTGRKRKRRYDHNMFHAHSEIQVSSAE